MGLFADIWNWAKSKVKDLISSGLTTFKSWVNDKISDAISAIDWAITNITNYITNVYETINKYITNVYNTTNQYITNIIGSSKEWVNARLVNMKVYVDSVVGASRKWVDNRLVDMKAYVDSRIKLWDPIGFLKDPPGYIGGLFALLSLAKETKMIESFLEGFEEGLEE